MPKLYRKPFKGTKVTKLSESYLDILNTRHVWRARIMVPIKGYWVPPDTIAAFIVLADCKRQVYLTQPFDLKAAEKLRRAMIYLTKPWITEENRKVSG